MRTMRKRVLALALSTAMALSMCVTTQAAGPEVTAGGVFADILRLSAYLGSRI